VSEEIGITVILIQLLWTLGILLGIAWRDLMKSDEK